MDLPPYSPGLHKLVTLHVGEISKLTNSKGFVVVTNSILEKYELEKVGVVVHDFDNDSFTISYCLKESHISIGTLPEYNQVLLDVYLSGSFKENAKTVQNIVADYVSYFDAEVIKDFEINR